MRLRRIRGIVAASTLLVSFGGVGAAAAPVIHTAVAAPFVKPDLRTHFTAPPTTAQCVAALGLKCYGPTQYQAAYNLAPLYGGGFDGTGKTIAIVDSFGSPTIQADLAKFDTDYGLPAPPSFTIIHPAGPIPPFDPTNSDMVGWAEETSLDVEYAHAIAPGANILLVETPVSETEGTVGFPEIVKSELFVIKNHLADVISQSFGATEETFPDEASLMALRSAFIKAKAADITVLGASGDGGATDYKSDLTNFYTHRVDSWPSTDPLVTSVGGTQLWLTQSGDRTENDNVWNDTNILGSPAASGGGTSEFFPRPSFQDPVMTVTGANRGTPDISMSAAVDGAALVYMSFAPLSAGYYLIGGTSEATPLFSGVVAIADQVAGHDLGWLNPKLYKLAQHKASGVVDITTGYNTVTFVQHGATYTVPGFAAVTGYDLSTGLGTVDATQFVGALTGAG